METYKGEAVSPIALERIVKLAASGNERAFEQLVTIYESAVYNAAFYMTKNREDALDISQEVFVRLWQSLPSFRGDCRIKSYLMRLTKNASLDLLRRKSRRQSESLTVENDKGEEVQLDIPDESVEANPEEAYLRDERIRKVREGIMKLDEADRQIIVMRDMEGMSYAEIVIALGINEGTVKSRLHRARSELKKILEKGNYF
jgi:RNA polymerase sigma-70 factor (ECF subfamily)